MKNKFLKILAIVIMLPVMLFTGCKKDDGGLISEAEISEKYFNAIERSASSTIYSVNGTSVAKSNGVVIGEDEISKTADGTNSYRVYKDADRTIKSSFIKIENNQYVEYQDDNGEKTTRFVSGEDANEEIVLLPEEDDEIFGLKSEYELKEFANKFFEKSLGIEESDIESRDEAAVKMELLDKDSYLMTLSAGCVGNGKDSYYKAMLVYKIWFNNSVTKYYTKLTVVELNQDKTVKENGSNYYMEVETTIKYEFDESLKISDFSSYPSID